MWEDLKGRKKHEHIPFLREVQQHYHLQMAHFWGFQLLVLSAASVEIENDLFCDDNLQHIFFQSHKIFPYKRKGQFHIPMDESLLIIFDTWGLSDIILRGIWSITLRSIHTGESNEKRHSSLNILSRWSGILARPAYGDNISVSAKSFTWTCMLNFLPS